MRAKLHWWLHPAVDTGAVWTIWLRKVLLETFCVVYTKSCTQTQELFSTHPSVSKIVLIPLSLAWLFPGDFTVHILHRTVVVKPYFLPINLLDGSKYRRKWIYNSRGGPFFIFYFYMLRYTPALNREKQLCNMLRRKMAQRLFWPWRLQVNGHIFIYPYV